MGRVKPLDWGLIRRQMFNGIGPYSSQYSSSVYDEIEEGVLDLVKALHAKGYWTWGSCESHALAQPRWVGVMFTTERKRERFIELLRASGVPLAFDRNVFPFDGESELRILIQNEVRSSWDYTKFFEMMYKTSVSGRFYPVAVRVCETSSRNPLAWMWCRFLKRFYLDRMTARLVEHILSLKRV